MEVLSVKHYKNYDIRMEFDETAEFGSPEACIVKNVYSKTGEFRGRWPLKKRDKPNKTVSTHER